MQDKIYSTDSTLEVELREKLKNEGVDESIISATIAIAEYLAKTITEKEVNKILKPEIKK
jgi:hypothetical protein